MKKYILLFIALFLAPCSVTWAQNYFVSSLATPGAATFTSDKIVDGVISLPFTASTQTFEIETNQNATVSCDASWCQASYSNGVLTLSVEENPGDNARTAILSVRSKDFHPLPITVKQEARLVFAVISDTHVGNSFGGRYIEKVSQTLKRLTGKSKLDALAVVGDLTDAGDASQYVIFDSLFSHPDHFINPVDKFLFMMGNHDNYHDSNNSNYRTGLKNFNIKNGRPTNYPLHQYALIKGYPFISISALAGANNDDNTTDRYNASYPKTTVTTLEKYLEQAVKDAPGKPIFIFTHVAPRNTCYSTWEDEGAVWAMRTLNPTLNHYPQAVVFCGHSHYPLGDPRSIHQGANPNSEKKNYYTVINTASITYSEINPNVVEGESNGIHPEGFKNVTEGMIIVEQPNGDIEIRRYDTYRDVEIDPEHRWVIKAPFDGSAFQYADIRDKNDNPNNVPLRDGMPAPVFDSDAYFDIEDITPTDVTVRFDQATDNECVFRYKIALFKNGKEVKSVYKFSQFYLTTDMPNSISYTFEGLTPGTDYVIEVTAYDSWDNQSDPMVLGFTTPTDEAPVPDPVGWWKFDNPNNLLASTAGVATLEGAYHDYAYVQTFNLEDLDIEAVEGPSAENGAVAVPAHNSLLMTTNLNTNSLNTYSFLMDIKVEKFNGIYTALYQNDLTNTKDGSLFINKNGQVGKSAGGLGYNGLITNTGWHRVIFVVKNNKAKIYIDGKLVGESTSPDETNWQMGIGALFFADNDDTDGTEENVVKTAEMRFWDRAITAGQAAELGTVPGIGDPVEVVIPEALGVWTFDNPNDLFAGTGTATLIEVEHSTNGSGGVRILPDGYAVKVVEGPAEGNGAVSVPVGTSMLMESNLNVTEMNTYSVMWDVKAADISSYIPLLQNDLNNMKDGSLFLYKNQVGLNAAGLKYHGTILNNKWYRILFVVEDGYGKIFVDGEYVSQSSEACDLHWKLTDGALFFADNDGEEKEIQTAEIRFWNVALDFAQAAKLGAPGAGDTPPEPTFPEAKGIWTFDKAADLLAGTGVATLKAATHAKDNVNVVDNPEAANLEAVEGPQEGNGAVHVPFGSSLMMTTNLEQTTLSSFTFMMDIKLDAIGSFMPLFQNDLNNSRDACLFVGKDGTLGIRRANLGYSSTKLVAGQWHRVVAVAKDAKMTVYLDGVKVVGESPDADIERWQLGTGVLFFADEDGEETDIQTAEIRFWDAALTASQVAELGTAGSDFVPEPIDPEAIPEEYGSWTFDNLADPLVMTGGNGSAMLQPIIRDNENGTTTIVLFKNSNISSYTEPILQNGTLRVPVGSALMLVPKVKNLSTYTFLMDIFLEDVSGFNALFQNDLTFKTDASLFVNDGQVGRSNAGLGYNGTINPMQWHRLVFVAKDNHATVYIDGQKVVQSIEDSETHWFMKEGLIFFADNDGEEKPTCITELKFWDKALTEKQIFKLGTINGGEAQPVAVPETTGAWTFDDPDDRYAGTGTASIVGWKKVGSTTLTGPLSELAPVAGPTEGNGAITVPVGDGLQMTTNLEEETLDSYSILMDIKLDDVNGFAALFQNDKKNEKDASLFVKNGQIGLNASSLGYNGTINPGQWHRVVFVCNRLFAYVYVDGVKVGRSTTVNENHWKMGKEALFFVDENEDHSEEKEVNLSDLRFWNRVLTEGEIEQLGGIPTE
jgi:predicted MPP superfamily phosphohydrolase